MDRGAMTDTGRWAEGTTAPASTAPGADAQLLDRAAGGDADAFDALSRPRLDRLFRMAVAITRSEPDARDAVQEACVHAWRELPRLRDRTRFDAWLAQILVNGCRSLLRRRKRTTIREIAIDEVGLEGGGLVAPVAPPSPLEGLSERDLIQRAFERLDPTVRALLVLHYVEERPLADIGRLTGSPVGTVKWRLSNARRALDRALKVERR